MTGFPQNSIHRLIQKYLSNDCQIISHVKNRGRRPDKIPQNVQDWILDRNQLERHALLSLEHRVVLIRGLFDYKITTTKLRIFYKANNIAFLRPQLAYCAESKLDQRVHHNHRVVYARSLLRLM